MQRLESQAQPRLQMATKMFVLALWPARPHTHVLLARVALAVGGGDALEAVGAAQRLALEAVVPAQLERH